MKVIKKGDLVMNCDLCNKETSLPAAVVCIQINSRVIPFTCLCPDCEKKIVDGINGLIKPTSEESK